MIGQTLKQFRVVAKLGEGGMGVVYRAIDETLRREVALKVLPSAVAGDDERRRRFLREARSAAAVTHPNIATVYEVGEVDGTVFIAMELIDGDSLRDRIDGGMPRGEALRIAKEVARGLARAHDKGVVHRDLKPENVMVTGEGDVKVLDFGLAKLREGEGPDPLHASMTAPGRIMGTPGYMSPEQAEGRPDVDARSDVFSFGVILYEMLAGVRPFRGPSTVAILYAVVYTDPPPIGGLVPDLAPELAAFIARCLRKAPGERFESARELVQSLGGESSHASVSAAVPMRAPPGERIATVSGMGTALGATMASGPVPALPAMPPSPIRRRRWLARSIAGLAVAVLAVVGLRGRTKDPRATLEVVTASPSSEGRAPPRGRPMTEAPMPHSRSPEALVAYASALARLRVGGIGGYAMFEKAATLDPSLAPADLRLTLYTPLYALAISPAERRTRYQAAAALTSTLDAHDQALLPVAEVASNDPLDFAAAIAKAKAATERFPDDPEALLVLFYYEWFGRQAREARTLGQHLLELDPHATAPLALEAAAARANDEPNEASALATKCLSLSPNAANCTLTLLQLDADEGKCSDELTKAQTLAGQEPEEERPYAERAQALDATLARAPAIELALQQADARRVDVSASVPLTPLVMALRAGDFTAAESAASAIDKSLGEVTTEREHAQIAAIRIAIAEETGNATRALAIADAYAAQAKAWAPNAPLEVRTKRIFLAHEAGRLPSADFAVAFDKQLAEGFKFHGVPAANQDRSRLVIEAENAMTPAEAKAALDRGPFHPSGNDLREHAAALGRLLALGGRADQAVPILERVTKSCQTLPPALVLDHERLATTLDYLHAQLLYGEAVEATDKTAACQAYNVVRSRWQGAKPRSVTLERANQRAKALACPPPSRLR